MAQKKKISPVMDSIPILATSKVAPGAAFTVSDPARPNSRPQRRPSLLQAFLEHMQLDSEKYRPAQLYDAGGDLTKEWYVYYYFLNPETGKFERQKERFNINRVKGLAERKAWGNRAVLYMNQRLKSGYDPFKEAEILEMMDSPELILPDPALIIPAPVVAIEPVRPLPSSFEGNLVTLQKVVDKLSRGATKDAKDTYRTMFNRWASYVREKGFDKLQAQEITTDHVKALMEYLQHDKENARKTINTTKAHLGQFWDVLKDQGIVSLNPFRSVKAISKRAARRFANKPKDRYMPPTTEELERIVQHLKNIEMRGFLRFVAMIYYEWVRPEEIVQLRILNIDMKSATITFSTDITKNDKTATIQIVPPMLKLLKEMEIERYPKHFYLFSEDYLPGSSQLNAKNACNNTWQRHVKGKLGVSTNPYSLKHKGNIDYVLNNKGNKYDAKWHQMQNRHASLTQTEQYMRDLGVYFVDTEQLNFQGFL